MILLAAHRGGQQSSFNNRLKKGKEHSYEFIAETESIEYNRDF